MVRPDLPIPDAYMWTALVDKRWQGDRLTMSVPTLHIQPEDFIAYAENCLCHKVIRIKSHDALYLRETLK